MENHAELSENSQPCLNCGTPLSGNYCGKCGQEEKEYRRPFFRLSKEALVSLFELDGRSFRTLFFLLTKPAHLSREYFSGRRARYTPPLRLFLVISVSFFLLVSFYTSIQSMESVLSGGSDVIEENIEQSEVAQEGVETGLIVESGEDDNGLAEILALVDVINIPFLDEQTNSNLRAAMATQAETNFDALIEDPNGFLSGYLEYITIFILLMIPLLALLQKIIYIRNGHYYVEHLILTLHNHTFIILILFITSLTGFVEDSALPVVSTLFGFIGTLIFLWMWAYLFLSLKNYFQQGFGITLLKFLTTTFLYSLTLSMGILIFAALLFFLL